MSGARTQRKLPRKRLNPIGAIGFTLCRGGLREQGAVNGR